MFVIACIKPVPVHMQTSYATLGEAQAALSAASAATPGAVFAIQDLSGPVTVALAANGAPLGLP